MSNTLYVVEAQYKAYTGKKYWQHTSSHPMRHDAIGICQVMNKQLKNIHPLDRLYLKYRVRIFEASNTIKVIS